MTWTGITIRVPTQETEDAVVQVLLGAGCAGVALDGDLPDRTVTSYLSIDNTTETKLNQITAALRLLPSIGIVNAGEPIKRTVDEEDWANSWKEYFKPIRIGRRLIVSPPWENPQLSERDILLTIDPGMAFGTGTHATTQLCLSLLEEYVHPGLKVADIGTGSGILAIAASKLGAGSVTAVDNDLLAVKIAGENAIVNGVTIAVGSEFPDNHEFDIVVANIIADTIIDLSEPLASITASQGILIASGIIEGRENDVRMFLEGSGFTSIETRTQGEWVGLVLRRISD